MIQQSLYWTTGQNPLSGKKFKDKHLYIFFYPHPSPKPSATGIPQPHAAESELTSLTTAPDAPTSMGDDTVVGAKRSHDAAEFSEGTSMKKFKLAEGIIYYYIYTATSKDNQIRWKELTARQKLLDAEGNLTIDQLIDDMRNTKSDSILKRGRRKRRQIA